MTPEQCYDSIHRPAITEKSMRGAEWNQVTFQVDRRATKKEIRQAVEDAGVYGGPVNTVAELLTDTHFSERAFFETWEPSDS